MNWSSARAKTVRGRRGVGRARRRGTRSRRPGSFWRAAVLVVVPSLAGSGLAPVPLAVVAAGATAAAAASVAVATQPARASLSGSVLILSTSVNGGSSSVEAQQASALGLSVTVDSPTQWDALHTSDFESYAAIIIGDPSTSTLCASSVPSDALSTAGTWGPAVTGNVAVVGTAPVLGGATTLVKDGIAYAASGRTTGVYVSLNCEYSSASAGTSVPLLGSVNGGGFAVTGQGSNCSSDAGTVNTWQALALTPFNGLTSSNLGPWSSPACSVEESFTAWPAGLGGLAYYAGALPATFTASDGATGQAYILAGAPASTGTAALTPSTGGQVPAEAAPAGQNPAAPGVDQPTADGVNTADGDFTQSATDLNIPTFGPSLAFSRTYDAQAAQTQTQAATPGSMGYGWTDNWATSLSSSPKPVPGNIYTVDGTRLSGLGGPPTSVAMWEPQYMMSAGGNTYVADTLGNRVLEIAGSSGTQWGISMSAGDEYVIAGSPAGLSGRSADGTPAAASLLDEPEGLTIDPSGNLYIADFFNNQVVELAASTGTQWGISMTAGDVYRVAGHGGGSSGTSGDGGSARSGYLSFPTGVQIGHGSSDLYVADSGNNRIQEIPAESGSQWGQSMTSDDVYTVVGSASGNSGTSGNGVAATSAMLYSPQSVTFSAAHDMYIADTFNDRIVEVAAASGTQWGISMTQFDIYTVAGSVTGASGSSGNGGAATSALLNSPNYVEADNGTQLYIADTLNNQIREVAQSTHTEWGQQLTANDIYAIAGTGTAGFSGDGGTAASAKLDAPVGLALDGSFNLYVGDTYNDRLREVSASTAQISEYAGSSWSLYDAGNSGPAVQASLFNPEGVATDPAGNVYMADNINDRVQEIAVSSHNQFGIGMTAGDVYTIAGDPHGASGSSGDRGPATSARLNGPGAVAVDAVGNVYISDIGNNKVREVAAATGTQWGISMTAGDIYTVAGTGTGGNAGNSGLATSAQLWQPVGLAVDRSGDLLIADTMNDRVQLVAASSGTRYGVSVTANDVYTIAGSSTGAGGDTGDGGPATSAKLFFPDGVITDSAGDLYIADTANSRVQEVYNGGVSWGQHMTANDIYTIAGSATGATGTSGDRGPAAQALLNSPFMVTTDSAGDVYLTDSTNNRVQEIAAANGAQWGQQMTAGDIYTVAGSATGASGQGGDGGPATTARFNQTEGLAVDPSGNLYVTDFNDDRLREVVSATSTPFPVYPAPGSTVNGTTYLGGVVISQADGAQVTFYPVGSGCVAPYVAVPSGQYCALPQDVGANLSYSGGSYTFAPQPGTTYTYNSAGQLTGESDAAGNTLNVAYGTPLPGSGNCPSAASWCQLISAADGRTLTVGYNGGNLVTSVTDPIGRKWAYSYTGSDLTSVTDPMSNVTSYAYGAGSTGNPLNANDLTTITRPNEQAGGPDAGTNTSITYDAAGQVTAQTDPMAFTTGYTWTGLNPATGNGVATVSDADGDKTVYDYVQGTLAAESGWTGTTLTSEDDNVPDQAVITGDNSAGTQLDTATADGGADITTTSFDTSGNPVSVTAPGGLGALLATTTQQSTDLSQTDCTSDETAAQTCQAAPGPSPVAPGGAIAPPASAPPQGETWTLYDTDGNELYSTTGVYEPGSNAASYSQTTYQLFQGNSVTLNGNNITCAATPPSASLPCATINADGVVTQLAYDSVGDLASSSTPDGNGSELATSTYGYDGDGEETSVTSPDGNVAGANAGNYTTITAYNGDGLQTSVTQSDGAGHTVTPRATNYGYDANANPTAEEDPRGFTTTITYNAADQATLATNPDGNATLTCYDGSGQVAQVVPSVGVAANNLTPASCPDAYPAGYGDQLATDATTYTFDTDGSLTAMTTPAPAGQSGSETTTYSYDGQGNLVQTTAPPATSGGPNQITANTYNAADELASETTGYGTSAASTVSYCYDPTGDTTSVVYADGNSSGTALCEMSSPWVVNPTSYPTQAGYQTTYSYDSAGELVSTTTPATAAAPNGATTALTYDPEGNQLTSKDPNGTTTTQTYSPLGQTATVSYSGGSAHSVSIGRDADGSSTSMTDATGTSSYIWDPFSELTSATNGAGQTTGYGYNADGAVTSITYPLPSSATWATSDTVSYTVDNADQLISATDFNGNRISIGNTADGLPNSLTLGASGDSINTTYDNTDRPSVIKLKNSTTTLQSFTYSDSPAGTIMSETDTPTSSHSPATYSYDAKGRVTSMTPGSGSTLNYSFDPSGNLTTLPTGASATYDKAGELTSSALSGTTTSSTYNADGQRLTSTQGPTTIASGTWNGAAQLASYSDHAADMTSATYDGYGLRASATTSAGTQQFTWNTNAPIPQLLMDSNNAYIYAGGRTAPAEQVNLTTGKIGYLVTDTLSSIRGAVDSSGNLTATTSYDAWGNPTTSGGLTASTPFGYAGGYTDPTGLIYMINRYYDPGTGQFTSVDPDLSQTLQPYAYANDDPVLLSDPTGLTWWTYGTKVNNCGDACFTQWFDFSHVFTEALLRAIEPKHGKPPVKWEELPKCTSRHTCNVLRRRPLLGWIHSISHLRASRIWKAHG